MAKELECRVVWGADARTGCGVALVIANRLPVSEENIRWNDPDGRTLVVDLTMHGKLPVRLVVSHAPPDSDAARTRYYARLRRNLPNTDDNGRRVIWVGDHNMVEDEVRDRETGAPEYKDGKSRENMLDAYGERGARSAGSRRQGRKRQSTHTG